MEYKSPYDYLKSEYLRLNGKNDNKEKIDLDTYFINARKKYGNNINQYNYDKTLFKKLQKIADKLAVPINEQDKGSYWLLNRHSQNILEIFKDNNIKIDKEIILGTLPTESLNAYASRFPDEKMLIVFNIGLMRFLYLMGRIISSLITKENKGNNEITLYTDVSLTEDIVEANRISQLKFFETILLYKNNNLSNSKIYFETDINKGVSCCLYDNAELFVTSHEYAHIVLVHLFDEKNIFTKQDNKEPILMETLANWQDELAADISAFRVTLAYNNKSGNGSYGAYLGIEFLFSCFNLIEKIENRKFSESHPNAINRIEVIRNHYKNSKSKNASTIIKDCEIIPKIFEKLWDCYEKDIVNNDIYN